MNIVIGADHRGFALKEHIKAFLSRYQWYDVGTSDAQRTDYPLYAQKACDYILQGRAERGVLICGSGIGMAIAANRYKGIYAGLCWNDTIARIAHEDDGTNVLVLPSDFLSEDDAVRLVLVWLNAPFKGGRYQDRLDMVDK